MKSKSAPVSPRANSKHTAPTAGQESPAEGGGPFTFQTIRQPSVVELIIENVKQALIRGELHAGDRLPSENELAQQMGVGRSAVREAMKVLSALGVVDIRQGDGTYIVDKPSSALLSPLVFSIILERGLDVELFELRNLIQVGYTELAAQKATEDDLARIEAAAEVLEKYTSMPNLDKDYATQLDLAFHYAILDATHNPLVIRIGRTVEELFFSTIRSALIGNIDWALKSHRRIFEAVRQRNVSAIREAIEFSLLRWRAELNKRE